MLQPLNAISDDTSYCGSLSEIAEEVPLSAGGAITLSNVQAARRQLHDYVSANASANAAATIFLSMYLSDSIDKFSLILFADAAEGQLGFRMDEICHLAGWGAGDSFPTVISGVNDKRLEIAAALERRQFSKTEVSGSEIWTRSEVSTLEGLQDDIDPFGGMLGREQRFAIDSNVLRFARDANMSLELSPGIARLASEPSIAAILTALQPNPELGEVIDVMLLPEQPSRFDNLAGRMDLPETISENEMIARLENWRGYSLPGLPKFSRYAIAHWRKAEKVSATVIIPFSDRSNADLAVERIETNLNNMDSMINRSAILDLFPQPRSYEVRRVRNYELILWKLTEKYTDIDDSLVQVARNPFIRLADMVRVGEIGLLLGADDELR